MIIIDRFEGDYAVLEFVDGTFNFPRRLLPAGVQEGDVLSFHICRDEAATRKRKEKAVAELDEWFSTSSAPEPGTGSGA